jgi:DNA-binding NarL/FixJ family response regulator
MPARRHNTDVVRVLIVDDHALFRESLRSLLSSRGIEVVGEAANGREAVEKAHQLEPDVVLMDLAMPEMNGLDATRILVAELPSAKVVVLSSSSADADLFEAIKSGAQGYLLKDLHSDEFLALLEGVGRGEPALQPGLTQKLLNEFAQPDSRERDSADRVALTDRELDVLRLLVCGVIGNRELAQTLCLAENTVKFHLRNIFKKLEVSSRAEAVAYAIRHGLCEADPRAVTH